MHSHLPMTAVLIALVITPSISLRSENTPPPASYMAISTPITTLASSTMATQCGPPPIARISACLTSNEEWVFQPLGDEGQKCFQVGPQLLEEGGYGKLVLEVIECLHRLYTNRTMTSNLALNIRDTPSFSKTSSNSTSFTATAPTCTTTLYTEPLFAFGPTSTVWAKTTTSVRSVDCSGCDLAILSGGHVYKELEFTATITIPSTKTAYVAECMVSP